MKKYIWIIGITLGLTAGYLYWFYIGCASGSCAITSSPVNSSLYGGLLGFLVVNSFKKSEPKKDPEQR